MSTNRHNDVSNIAATISAVYLQNRTVCISLKFGPNRDYIGSAVCVEIDGRIFLATAGHNFEDADRATNINFFSANRNSRSPLTVLSQRNERWTPGVEPDLTWLEVDATSARRSDLLTVSLDSISLNPLREWSDTFIATGFPGALVETPNPTGGNATYTIHLLIYVTYALPEPWVERGDIVLSRGRFARDHTGQDRPMVHPGGMSGGGMWCDTSVGDGTIWSPERIRLIGITRLFIPRNDQNDELVGVPIRTWLEMVAADIPELQPTIEHALNR